MAGNDETDLAVLMEYPSWLWGPSPNILHQFPLEFKELLPLSLAMASIFSFKLRPSLRKEES